MLDIKFIIENPDRVREGALKKNIACDIDAILKLYEELKPQKLQIETLRARQNEVSKNLPQAEDKEDLLKEMASLKENLKTLEATAKTLEDQINELSAHVPNPPDESLPVGKDDTLNEVLRTEGSLPIFDFDIKDHVTLGKELDILDIESAVACSGARFYYLKNEGALLEMALIQFVLQKLYMKGFSPILPPALVREASMFATGFFPSDKTNIYHVNPDEDNLFLIGTSEVPLCMLHADKILQLKDLPLRYCGFSPCFRREAGSYGKDTQGIIRVHQFNKVEMFSFCHPEKSEEEHQMLLEIEEEIFRDLGLPYQVVKICTGDLGTPTYKKFDLEAWIPSQETYREVTSCSNCTDFQARRAKIRYKNAENEKKLVHTLNGTAIALPRTVVAIIENNQDPNGNINIPEILRPFMAGIAKIEKK